MNELMAGYMRVHLFGQRLSVSHNILILGICGIGYCLSRFAYLRITNGRDRSNSLIIRGWLATFGVLALHMILLAVLLDWYYGYGYEKNPTTFGWIGMFYLLCLTLWQILGLASWRRCIQLVLIVYYVMITFGVYQT